MAARWDRRVSAARRPVRPRARPLRAALGIVLAVVALAGLAGVWWGVDAAWDRGAELLGPTVAERPTRVELAELPKASDAVRVDVGRSSACLLTGTGAVFCWGANGSGQLGRAGGAASRPDPVDTTGALKGRTITAISVGDDHACVLDSKARAFCWGADSRGQLGAKAAGQASDAPVAVAGGHRLTAIHAGGATTCAADDGGALYCWGANEHGQLGDGTTTDRRLPTRVALPAESGAVTSFAVGDRHTCAVLATGAYCWGAGDRGQLGTGSSEDSSQPVAVETGEIPALSSVSAAGDTTCGRTEAGALFCWGAGDHGQLGNDARTDSAVPVRAGVSDVWRYTVGPATTCVIRKEGSDTQRLYCWGEGSDGQLGDGKRADSTTPVAVRPPNVRWERVSPGGSTTCGVDRAGRAWCWGRDSRGLLGDG